MAWHGMQLSQIFKIKMALHTTVVNPSDCSNSQAQ
jgi:hypothetical protein